MIDKEHETKKAKQAREWLKEMLSNRIANAVSTAEPTQNLEEVISQTMRSFYEYVGEYDEALALIEAGKLPKYEWTNYDVSNRSNAYTDTMQSLLFYLSRYYRLKRPIEEVKNHGYIEDIREVTGPLSLIDAQRQELCREMLEDRSWYALDVAVSFVMKKNHVTNYSYYRDD